MFPWIMFSKGKKKKKKRKEKKKKSAKEKENRMTYLPGKHGMAPYLKPSHVPWVSCCFQTILIALEEKF